MSNVATIDQRPQEIAVVGESAAMLSMIERAARDPSVDVDKFERLMLMKERVEREAARKAFNAAVSAAKGQIPPIARKREVDFTSQKGRTHYRHEDFAGIARIVDPILKVHGLTYRHKSDQNGPKLRVTCILSHDAGHYEETSLEASEDTSGNKNGIQAIGSTATYLQRYTLKLALGLSTTDEDDDGAASTHGSISLQTLVDDGRRIALDEGATALGQWWMKTLSRDQRKNLGSGVIGVLKWIAENSKNAPIDGYADNYEAE